MVTLVNRAKMSTSTTGTGTITLGSAETGYQSFADAGVADGDEIRYVIEDGDAWEIGSGTYTASGTTLSRTVDESSNSDAALNLTGSAVVFITAAAEDIPALYSDNEVSVTTQPSATGDDAVAIGDSATASAANSMAIGHTASTSGSYSVALGRSASSTGISAASIGYNSTASGTQSVALGYSSTASGTSALAGPNSTASATNSVAIGQAASASNFGGAAFGKGATTATNNYNVAIGNSYTSGEDAFAAAIANNSSSYGATGANSIAMGDRSKATGSRGVAIGGYNAIASGTSSVATGYQAEASTTYAHAHGYQAKASGQRSWASTRSVASGNDSWAAAINDTTTTYGSQHAYSVALGYQAVTTADYQIALGSSTAQVKVSGAYTLPTSDGTNGQVLTTDGSGAVTFADAGGGSSLELFVENPSSPTTPLAGGTNGVAIGSGSNAGGSGAVAIGVGSAAGDGAFCAINGGGNTAYGAVGNRSIAMGEAARAQGQDSVAIGENSLASSADSFAIGYNTDATATNASAFGYNAQAAGSRAIALGNSRAGGTDSFAAQIGTNSSSYGAIGNNGTAIGMLTKANGLDFVFGRSSVASGGSGSLSLGMDNTSSGGGAVTIGKNNTASHTDAVVIGQGASSSAADEITLGHTDQTVRISSSYTLPTSDGTNGQVLTTDGSGAVTFADAGGGGADLFAENYDGTSTLPSATGTNAVAIGSNSTASGNDGIAIGTSVTASVGFRPIVLGYNSSATQTSALALGTNSQATALGSVAIGGYGTTSSFESRSSGTYSIAIGVSSDSTATGSLALGYNSQAITGANATALTNSYASGADSFAAAIANNTSSYGATGANSVAIGDRAKATASDSFCIANVSTASGTGASVLGGQSSTASGSNSTTIGGGSNVADGDYSTAKGYYGNANGIRLKHATGVYPNQQGAYYVLGYTTSDATPIALNTSVWTPSATNQITLPNNSAFTFSGTIIAREDATDGSDYASWEIKGAIIRDANAASTVLGQGIINKLYATSGASAWAIDLSADTTFGCLKVQATGAASTNIRWVATVNTSEVTYA